MQNMFKNTIYERANNVLLLSIIEAIGMNYQKEMPGYALELASSMELIYFVFIVVENLFLIRQKNCWKNT